MQACARVLLSILISPVLTSAAWAQEPRVFVGIKAGVTAENSEDGLTGTVPALGGTASIAFTPKWRAEVEFWLPGYLDDEFGEPKHRDVLFGVSAKRIFAARRMQPFLLAGLSF